MKPNIRHFVCALALLVLCFAGFAQEAAPASKGKVAVLTNDRILQGDIELVGKQYRIRRSIGESWLPAEQVRCLCATLEDAFAYLRAQANLNDADERLRLARWCHLHGLKQQAADEAAAAVKLRPEHAESQRLLKGIQRSLSADVVSEPTAAEAEPEAATPNLPYNAESLGLYVNKVQPILMNACAKCHACGKGGAFKLARVYDEGGLGNRRTTQQNLMATLAQLDRDRPLKSALLSYALTLHGNAERPPLPGRTAPAYRTLEDWVQQAMSGLPRLAAGTPPVPLEVKNPTVAQPPVAAAPAAQAPATGASWITKWQPPMKPDGEAAKDPPQPMATAEPGPGQPASKTPKDQPKPAVAADPSMAQSASQPVVEPPATEFAGPRTKPEAEKVQPVDPFDPVIFNRQMHPGK